MQLWRCWLHILHNKTLKYPPTLSIINHRNVTGRFSDDSNPPLLAIPLHPIIHTSSKILQRPRRPRRHLHLIPRPRPSQHNLRFIRRSAHLHKSVCYILIFFFQHKIWLQRHKMGGFNASTCQLCFVLYIEIFLLNDTFVCAICCY